jgi:hypothetical protein
MKILKLKNVDVCIHEWKSYGNFVLKESKEKEQCLNWICLHFSIIYMYDFSLNNCSFTSVDKITYNLVFYM